MPSDQPALTPDHLAILGRALHPDRTGWMPALAQRLGLSERHLRRLLNGETPITAGVAADVRTLMAEATGLRTAETLQVVGPPAGSTPEDEARDGACWDALTPALDALARAAEAIGWHPAEVATVALGWSVRRLAEGAGQEATLGMLDEAAAAVRAEM